MVCSIDVAMENEVFLQLGRLDGRLAQSPARTVWAARMRMRAIAAASVAAGIPVEFRNIETWLATGSDMPRRREGLNDPLRLSTIAHLTLAAQDLAADELTLRASNFMTPMFNHRAVAIAHAPEEILALMVAHRATLGVANQRGLPSITIIGERMTMLREAADVDLSRTFSVVDPRDRAIHFAQSTPTMWLAATAVPLAFQRLGLTNILMPNLIPSLRIMQARSWSAQGFSSFLWREVKVGAAELDRLEQKMDVDRRRARTARSRLGAAATLRMAFPSITAARLAGALGTTVQGGGYLLRQLKAA